MNTFDFFLLLFDYPQSYILSLFLALILFVIVSLKTTSSWLNPIRFQLFTFALGVSVLIFLFLNHSVTLTTMSYVLSSIVIFWSVFLLIYRNTPRKVNITIDKEPYLSKYLFYYCYTIFIILTLISYIKLGIPLFGILDEKSRLSTYTGTGLGFISRISPILNLYSTFFIIHLLHSKRKTKNRFLGIILLLPLLIIGVLSGSRSSFLSIIFIFWGYRTMYVQQEPKAINYKYLILIFVFFSLFSFSFQSNSDLNQSSYLFFERSVAAGDIYWESLPDDNWKNVIVKSPVLYSLAGFFGPLRIIDATKLEPPIGFQLTALVFPERTDYNTGPVALFPIYTLICFGSIFGLIITIAQALIAALLLKLTFIRSKSIIVCSLSFYLFSSYLYFFGDLSAAFGMLFETIAGLIFFGMIWIWVYLTNYKELYE
jgi:oligosaccharide repeat unit polymerase